MGVSMEMHSNSAAFLGNRKPISESLRVVEFSLSGHETRYRTSLLVWNSGNSCLQVALILST